ncbi:Uu.00g096110.m01.CDS01 [Anthostomella pinea]|uniref:Uu.00g096110.m01.CDS01 n=1 Tax=Anthostomella pinea TaxID=933095 RepID=A0AAI8YEX5_9PEZI|nr:Uu.00g096110.m01.CDS01 [Anthostomella pinea]
MDFIEALGEGGHSYVWKVKINGSLYALKMFKYFDPSDLIDLLETTPEEVPCDSEDILNYFDPFNNECRAYGRLKELGREDLAVQCYGYMILDKSDEKVLAKKGITRWYGEDCWYPDNPGHDPSQPVPERGPIRALVKEYVERTTSFEPKDVPRMHRELRALHRGGILHRDIKKDNYINSKFLDLSNSWTMPHVMLDLRSRFRPKREIYHRTFTEWAEFDHMISGYDYRERNDVWCRALPNIGYRRKLRRPNERYRGGIERAWSKAQPAHYKESAKFVQRETAFRWL